MGIAVVDFDHSRLRAVELRVEVAGLRIWIDPRFSWLRYLSHIRMVCGVGAPVKEARDRDPGHP